jgi:hypothetical protein
VDTGGEAPAAPGADYAHQFNPPFALAPGQAALVVVDMQYASGSRDHGLGRALKERGQEALGAYRFDRIERVVVPTIQRLLAFFRAHGLRVCYLTVGSELPDYSDLPPHMRAFAESAGNTRGHREHEILDALPPRPGEAVLNKTTMSAFHSSGFERLLRSWSSGSCSQASPRTRAWRHRPRRRRSGLPAHLVEDGCSAASQALRRRLSELPAPLGRVAGATPRDTENRRPAPRRRSRRA